MTFERVGPSVSSPAHRTHVAVAVGAAALGMLLVTFVVGARPELLTALVTIPRRRIAGGVRRLLLAYTVTRQTGGKKRKQKKIKTDIHGYCFIGDTVQRGLALFIRVKNIQKRTEPYLHFQETVRTLHAEVDTHIHSHGHGTSKFLY